MFTKYFKLDYKIPTDSHFAKIRCKKIADIVLCINKIYNFFVVKCNLVPHPPVLAGPVRESRRTRGNVKV